MTAMTRPHHGRLQLLLSFLLFTAFTSALPAVPSPSEPSNSPLLPAATPPPSLATSTPSSSDPTTPLPVAAPTSPGNVDPVRAAVMAANSALGPPDGPPDYDALIPADPEAEPRKTANLADYGLTQVTYYSCATYAATTQCGWHRPLMPVASSAPPRSGGRQRAVIAASAAGLAGFVALMALL